MIHSRKNTAVKYGNLNTLKCQIWKKKNATKFLQVKYFTVGVKLLPPPAVWHAQQILLKAREGVNPKAKPQFLDPPGGFTCPTNSPETTGGGEVIWHPL